MEMIIGDYYEIALGDKIDDDDCILALPLVSINSTQFTSESHRNIFELYPDNIESERHQSSVMSKRIRKHLPRLEYPEYYL
jgi:hypothetical protein